MEVLTRGNFGLHEETGVQHDSKTLDVGRDVDCGSRQLETGEEMVKSSFRVPKIRASVLSGSGFVDVG